MFTNSNSSSTNSRHLSGGVYFQEYHNTGEVKPMLLNAAAIAMIAEALNISLKLIQSGAIKITRGINSSADQRGVIQFGDFDTDKKDIKSEPKEYFEIALDKINKIELKSEKITNLRKIIKAIDNYTLAFKRSFRDSNGKLNNSLNKELRTIRDNAYQELVKTQGYEIVREGYDYSVEARRAYIAGGHRAYYRTIQPGIENDSIGHENLPLKVFNIGEQYYPVKKAKWDPENGFEELEPTQIPLHLSIEKPAIWINPGQNDFIKIGRKVSKIEASENVIELSDQLEMLVGPNGIGTVIRIKKSVLETTDLTETEIKGGDTHTIPEIHLQPTILRKPAETNLPELPDMSNSDNEFR